MKFRSDWQQLEKHETEVKQALEETCVVDEKGFVWKYNGKAFWDKLKELGHTSNIYGECSCKKPFKYMTVKEMEESGIPTGA